MMYVRKTPVILKTILSGVTQERAQHATDGPVGWSVVEVMCHLRDWEPIFLERIRLMLETDNAQLPHYDQEAMAKDGNYASQNLQAAFDAYLSKRKELVNQLSSLTEAQWQRRGTHPRMGEHSMVELAGNVALHDLNHIEQMVRALGAEAVV
jgi:uncharacterized damage-inducible protein DinB